MLELRKQNEVPGDPIHPYIRRVKKEQELTFVIYSPCFWGFFVHWASGRSIPCYEDRKQCPGHKLQYTVKWLGYLCVWNYGTRECEFLEVPRGAAKLLLEIVGKDTTLRGQRVKVKRGKGDQARIKWEILAPFDVAHPTKKLAQDRDPDAALRHIWGINEVRLRLAGSVDVPSTDVG